MSVVATDIADRLEKQFGLQPAALGAGLLGLLGELPAGVAIQDAASGRYLYVNERLASWFERSPGQLIDRCDDEWLSAAESAQLRAAVLAAAARSSALTEQHRLTLGGRAQHFSVTRQRLTRREGDAPTLCCAVWFEQSPAQAQAASAESTLFGGRAAFNVQLRRELDLSAREHREFALVSVAVDVTNPDYARQGASVRQCIEDLVERFLHANIRAMDGAFKLDPNRFAMLLSGVGLATAHARIEGLRRLCANEILRLEEGDLHFTVSMGVASYPHTTQDRVALVLAADAALEQAQRRGGNHVALASIRFEPPP